MQAVQQESIGIYDRTMNSGSEHLNGCVWQSVGMKILVGGVQTRKSGGGKMDLRLSLSPISPPPSMCG